MIVPTNGISSTRIDHSEFTETSVLDFVLSLLFLFDSTVASSQPLEQACLIIINLFLSFILETNFVSSSVFSTPFIETSNIYILDSLEDTPNKIINIFLHNQVPI